MTLFDHLPVPIEEHPSGRGKRVRYRYNADAAPGFPLPGEERL